jgi:hypothetical protein
MIRGGIRRLRFGCPEPLRRTNNLKRWINFGIPGTNVRNIDNLLDHGDDDDDDREVRGTGSLVYNSDFPQPSVPEIIRNWFRDASEVSWRITSISLHAVLHPQNVAMFTLSVCTVFGIGCYEAYLLSPEDVKNWQFILNYSYVNLIPSVVWDTIEAEVIARSMGLDPELLLRKLDIESSVEDALIQVEVTGLEFKRALIAGFMTIAQILRMVNITLKSGEYYRNRLLKGRESFLDNPGGERVIRLCGLDSYTTRLAIKRYGRNIVPVYENPEVRHVRRAVKKYLIWSFVLFIVEIGIEVGFQYFGLLKLRSMERDILGRVCISIQDGV